MLGILANSMMVATRTDHILSMRPALRRKSLLRRLIAYALHLHAVSNERAILARLSDEQLKDIGVSKTEVWRETGKPFWDAPAYFFDQRRR